MQRKKKDKIRSTTSEESLPEQEERSDEDVVEGQRREQKMEWKRM